MPLEERQKRWQEMMDILRRNNVGKWREGFPCARCAKMQAKAAAQTANALVRPTLTAGRALLRSRGRTFGIPATCNAQRTRIAQSQGWPRGGAQARRALCRQAAGEGLLFETATTLACPISAPSARSCGRPVRQAFRRMSDRRRAVRVSDDMDGCAVPDNVPNKEMLRQHLASRSPPSPIPS
jgi:hypothetical protein